MAEADAATFVCDECDAEEFKTDEALQQHVRDAHLTAEDVESHHEETSEQMEVDSLPAHMERKRKEGSQHRADSPPPAKKAKSSAAPLSLEQLMKQTPEALAVLIDAQCAAFSTHASLIEALRAITEVSWKYFFSRFWCGLKWEGRLTQDVEDAGMPSEYMQPFLTLIKSTFMAEAIAAGGSLQRSLIDTVMHESSYAAALKACATNTCAFKFLDVSQSVHNPFCRYLASVGAVQVGDVVSPKTIPMLDHRASANEPCLLVHGLAQDGRSNPPTAEAINVGAVFIKAAMSRQWKLQPMVHDGCNLLIYIAMSGSGKTRCMMETMAKCFGLYFDFSRDRAGPAGTRNVSDWDHISCDDVQLSYEQTSILAGDSADAAKTPNDLKIGVRHLLRCLVLSRLIPLLHVLQHGQAAVSPLAWLTFQLRQLSEACARSRPSIFASLFETLRVRDPHEIMTRFDQELAACVSASITLNRSINKQVLYLCVDEAQQLMYECKDRFQSTNSGGKWSMYEILVELFTGNRHIVVLLAGTNLRLRESTTRTRSAVAGARQARPAVAGECRVVTTFRSIAAGSHLRKILGDFHLQISSDLQSKHSPFNMLRGRPRFVYTFITLMLTYRGTAQQHDEWKAASRTKYGPTPECTANRLQHQINLQAKFVLKQTIQMLTTSRQRGDVAFGTAKSHFDIICDMVSKPEYPSHYNVAVNGDAATAASRMVPVNVLTQLEHLMMCHLYFGEKVEYPLLAVERFVNESLCRLVADKKNTVRIDEPIIIRSIINYFEARNYSFSSLLFSSMNNLISSASNRGFLVEKLLPAAFLRLAQWPRKNSKPFYMHS